MGHLSEVVKRFVKKTHCIKSGSINEPSRLLTEDVFLEMSMKKCIRDIELFGWPAPRSRDGENSPDGGRFHHW